MINVAILLQEYYPSDVRVRKEVHALLEIGCSIDLFCLKGESEPAYEIIDGVRIHRTDISKKRGSKLRYVFEYFIFCTRAYLWLRKLVKITKINVVHVHTLPDFLVFAARPAKAKGAKVILDMHEITPEFFMSKYGISYNHIVIKLLKIVERKSVQYADYAITVNKQLKEIFSGRAMAKNEVVVIMNTVNDATFPRLPKEKHEKFVAVYHGTLSHYYNFDLVIHAMSKIVKQLGDFEFHIYGSGTQFQEIQELVVKLGMQRIVFVHGKVNHALIPSILSNADLGILPIKKNIMSDLSFSNKLAEYVHYKIPVLSSELSAVMDYFPSDTVTYYKEGNENEFTAKLMGIMHNYQASTIASESAHLLYQQISWDVMKKRLQDLYSKCK